MLPPVDPAVLQRNVNFETLYNDLCTRKLNPDGSTRDTKKQRLHDEIRRNLTTARTNLLQNQILLQSLSDLPSKAADLPPELHSVIEIVTAQLSGQIQDTDREIVSGDVDVFLDNINTISDAISQQLSIVAELLCKIADPIKPPEIDGLPRRAERLKDAATKELPAELNQARIHLANTAYNVLTTHRHLLEISIQILEQTMHGALARHTKSKAEHIHARAIVLGLQAKIHTYSHPPPPEFVAALKNFKAGQGASEVGLRDREGLARRTLELYEKAGEKGMRDLAKRKEWLLGEIGRMEDEIVKLEQGV